MKIEKNPSLYFRWLKHDKDDLYPLLAFTDDLPFSGEYFQPQNGVFTVYGIEVSLCRGLIVVSDGQSVIEESDIIAHEYRHHVQFMCGWCLDSIGWDSKDSDSYELDIYNYFTQSKSEMDALRFAYRKVKSPWSRYWLDIIASRGVDTMTQPDL